MKGHHENVTGQLYIYFLLVISIQQSFISSEGETVKLPHMKTNTMGGLNPSVALIKTFLLLLVLVYLIAGVAKAEKTQSHETTIKINEVLTHLNKPPTNSIKSEDGDIIDCVDIYKQPAFDHPSLKNHIIQMTPSLFPERDVVSSEQIIEWTWQKSGSCPQGTVPIRRTSKEDILRATSVEQFGRRDRLSAGSGTIEYAIIHTDYVISVFFSAKGEINVWKVFVEPNEWSHSGITMGNTKLKKHAFIEAGWSIHPELFGDNQTRFYIYWTADDYGSTGCYNLKCPGFVQVSRKTTLGATIQPLSSYRGQQHAIQVAIYRDPVSPKWWVSVNGDPVGYYPDPIFENNFPNASTISWGGSVLNRRNRGRHTSTEMGSGIYARHGFGESAFIGRCEISEDREHSTHFSVPVWTSTLASHPNCYSVTQGMRSVRGQPGLWTFFGGAGGAGCEATGGSRLS